MKIPPVEAIQAFIDKRKAEGKDTTKQEKLLALAKAKAPKPKPKKAKPEPETEEE